jgi:dTDP-4-amino-4,6-dideoxygalactose transaminase
MNTIPHSCPWIIDEDISAVSSVLKSSMIGQGALVRNFERRMAVWLKAADAVAIGSGSAGICLALYGLGIGPGDEVVFPAYVCGSVLQATLMVGAQPVLCDVGPNWVVTTSEVQRVISKRSRALIIPHMYGIFADIASLRSLGLPIIEDCAQALDGEQMRTVDGDVAVLSFHPTKCLTSGEGGMVVAHDQEIINRMKEYRDGGKNCKRLIFSPLSDLCASLALSNLDRYEMGLLRRRQIADNYCNVIKCIRPEVLNLEAMSKSMFFRFPIKLPSGITECQSKFASYGVNVRRGVDKLLNRCIGQTDDEFPIAVMHYNTTVSLPIYPALTSSQEEQCINAIQQVLSSILR